MKIKKMSAEHIHDIKPLWENLNAYHLSKSTHFKNHFAKFTFEKRMEGLKKRNRLIVYVAEEGSEKVGYCIATVDGVTG